MTPRQLDHRRRQAIWPLRLDVHSSLLEHALGLGARIPDIPYVVTEWHQKHPDQSMPERAGVDPALARLTS